MQTSPKAFTQRVDGRATCLLTSCGICKAYNPKVSMEEPILQTTALWDTGATISTISKQVAETLGLIPFSKSKMYHAGGEGITNLYKVNIILPNAIGVQAVTVMEGVLNGCEVLIGMDIITVGDFVVTNRNGKTVFSFQTPSTHEYDFVKQIGNKNGKI